MRSTKLLVLFPAIVLALAGCKKESVEGPLAGCLPVSFTSSCSMDAECCSFGCVYGTCMPNPLEGGVCATHGDCLAPRLCIGGQCTTAACNAGGACSASSAPCCTGACTGGFCAVDRPPVAVAGMIPASPVPFRIPVQLTNGSYDPDVAGTGIGLSYAWTVSAPLGSTATFYPTSSYATPTFTPDVASTVTPYVLRLTASNAGGSSFADVTFYAVNTTPEIVMPPDVLGTTYQSRNVPLATTASVADADGGPITCTWSKKGPTDGGYTVVSGPTTCAGASGARATGTSTYTLNEDEAGTWEIRLSVDDSVNPVFSKSRFINVQNDPPVANAGPKRYGNLGLGAIPLNGTATDVNGDVTNGNVGGAGFTWSWTVTARPGGSSIPIGYEVGTTPSVSFTPDAEGTFTLTLTADDHHGGPNGSSGTSTVDVQVDPYILPLGEVADAVYVDGTDRVVLVETGAGNAYQLKIANPATLDVEFVVTLAARPTTVALKPDATDALVGEAGGRWEKVTGIRAIPIVATTVPATPGVALPADLVNIAHAGVCAYGVTGGGTVYRLFPDTTGTQYWDIVSCPTCTSGDMPLGMRTTTGTTWIWLLQTGTGRLGRYEIHTNCNLQTPSVQTYGVLQGTNGLWLSVDSADLYTTRTSVYDAAALTSRVNGLPVVPDHLRTTLVSSSVVGAVAQNATTALATFSRDATPGSTFTAGASKPFPILGFNGDAKSNYGRFAFVKSGGGAYYAIVRANVGTDAAPIWKWGLVNLGP